MPSQLRLSISREVILRIFVILLVSAAVLTQGLFKELDHDEYQFVASGTLLARHGLLPYRDYPYFHLPYLIPIYAAIFLVTDHLLLGARIFSIVCSFATLLLIASITLSLFRTWPTRMQRLAVAVSIVVLLASPAWMATSCRAWNHDLPTLLVVIAYLLTCRNVGQSTRFNRFIFVGALIGIATGIRLTFAPVAGAFALALLTYPSISMRQRWRMTLLFSLGFAISLIPCALTFALAPSGFIFGNFQYPLLNMAFREGERYTHGLTPGGKFGFIILQVLSKPGNLILFLLFVGSFALVRSMYWQQPNQRFDLRLLMLLLMSLFIGALVPTPLFQQYLFEPAVFMILSSMAMISCCTFRGKALRQCEQVFVLLVIVSLPSLLIGYRNVIRLSEWGQWVPVQVHEQGMAIAEIAHHGTVLTLSPIFPLEGHADIYPELATGPFAWRVGPFVNDSIETRLKMWDPDNLDAQLQHRQPSLVLLKHENDLDLPLIGYADEHHIPMIDIQESSPKNIHENGTALSAINLWKRS